MVVFPARVGLLVVVSTLVASCVNLSYPPGASRDGGALVAPKPSGEACTDNRECQSAFCVDGVCCKTECAGPCHTCAMADNKGNCTAALEDTDPRDKCEDQLASSCGTNGMCDGAGACKKYPPGTVCIGATCLVFDATLAGRCNADGVCEPGGKKDCAPFVCGPGGVCRTECTMNRDCATMDCQNGTCGKKALGTACQFGAECESTFCAQGVCCDKACDTSPCVACSIKGSEGVCTNVPAGMPPAAMAKGTCATLEAASCNTNGKCDGAGACQLYPAGTNCTQASCSTATLRKAGTCDGKMTCVVPAAVTCGGYTCASPTACRTTCMVDADCASPAVCGSSACGGLSAQYFRQTNLTDLAFSRTDKNVEFDWGGTSPSGLLNVDNFSVRWRGKLTPRFSESYIFYVGSDDGERLFVDGRPVIDKWTRHASVPEDVSAPITLTAGKPVDITLEYFENGGDANVRLSWSSKSEPRAVIPTSALAPQ
jgi:hypothetical protein